MENNILTEKEIEDMTTEEVCDNLKLLKKAEKERRITEVW